MRKCKGNETNQTALLFDLQPTEPPTEYSAYFDGSCEPVNPGGKMGWGFVIKKGNQTVCKDAGAYPPKKSNTNNIAEYVGFVKLLKKIKELELYKEGVVIYGDSSMVINQMFSTWKIKKGNYKPVALYAKDLRLQIPNIYGKWIPREMNEETDNLSKLET